MLNNSVYSRLSSKSVCNVTAHNFKARCTCNYSFLFIEYLSQARSNFYVISDFDLDCRRYICVISVL